jgi:hypothetical protein
MKTDPRNIRKPTSDEVLHFLIDRGGRNPEAKLGVSYVVAMLLHLARQGEDAHTKAVMHGESDPMRLHPILTTYYRQTADMLRAAFGVTHEDIDKVMRGVFYGEEP